jgi:hypothetical protein
MPRQACVLFSLLALLAIAGVTGCSKLPSVRFDSPFGQSEWVEVQSPSIVTGPFPALTFSVVNMRDRVLSVQVEIDQIEGDGDCENSFRLEPGRTFQYTCPQRSVAVGQRYRGDLRVYEDWGDTKLAEHRHRILEIQADEQGGLMLVGRPAK